MDTNKMLLNAKTAKETEKALTMGANVYAKDENGRTALFFAKTKEQVKLLVDAGADINATDDSGNTALFFAKTVKQAEALIDAGIDINKQNFSGRTALGTLRSPDYYPDDTPERSTSLAKKLIKILKEHGAKKSPKDLNLELYDVMDEVIEDEGKRLTKIKELIELGAKANADCLYFAKNAEETKLLLESVKGDNINYVRFGYGNTALIAAKDAEQTKLLIDAGAPVNIVDKGGHTALSEAKTAEQTKLLLDAGASVNMVCAERYGARTALFFAKTAEQTKLLLDAGANVNAKEGKHWGWTGATALFYADDAKQTQVLLDAGADVNIIDKQGQTALFFAKTKEQAKLLLDAGINVNQRDKEGKTAADYVEDSDVRNMIKIAVLRKDLAASKVLTDDIRSGMAKTKVSGYKHISRTPTPNKGGRED
ncbi:MAG: ankyrin repeat domain-containing protein [Alphaproteobacteria bacterium]|nr:ankyrin repeat domain-containing protein [Alphaproteobacteria bacterium]